MENIHGMEFWKKTSGIHFCLFHGLNFFWWIVFLFFHKENPTKIDPSTIRSNHVSSNPSFFWEGMENDDIGWLTQLTNLFYEKKSQNPNLRRHPRWSHPWRHARCRWGRGRHGARGGARTTAWGATGRHAAEGAVLLITLVGGVGRVGKKKPSVGKDF